MSPSGSWRESAKGSDRPLCPDPDLAKFWLAVRMASSSRLRLCRVSTSSFRASWSSCKVTSAATAAGMAAGTATGIAASACIWEPSLGLAVCGSWSTQDRYRFRAWDPLLSSISLFLHLFGIPTAPAMIQAPRPCPGLQP